MTTYPLVTRIYELKTYREPHYLTDLNGFKQNT